MIREAGKGARAFMGLPPPANSDFPDMRPGPARPRANGRGVSMVAQRLVGPGRTTLPKRGATLPHAVTLLCAANRVAHAAVDRFRRGVGQLLEERQRHSQDDALTRQQHAMRVADVMTRNIHAARPDDTVQHAARVMRQRNTGVLPVTEHDRLIGVVTDRDVALRLVAQGRDPAHTTVRDVMTAGVQYLFEDEAMHHAAATMAQQQIGVLPVMNRAKRLVGMVSLRDLAAAARSVR